MSNLTFRQDLNVFRGTYAECMAQKTENMKVYLAWDTHEIFIGNKTGKKVQYGVSENIFKELDKQAEQIYNKIHTEIETRMNEIDTELNSKIDQDLLDKVAQLEEAVREAQIWHVYD